MQVNKERKLKSKKKEKSKNRGLKVRQIPKQKLQNALTIITDPENSIWKDRNIACETIHNCRNEYANDISHMELRLRYAQTCLLRRDWNNLAKIILLYKPEKTNEYLLRIFAKYASICLSYSNQPLLKSFLQSFNCTEPLEDVLNKWTSTRNVEKESSDLVTPDEIN